MMYTLIVFLSFFVSTAESREINCNDLKSIQLEDLRFSVDSGKNIQVKLIKKNIAYHNIRVSNPSLLSLKHNRQIDFLGERNHSCGRIFVSIDPLKLCRIEPSGDQDDQDTGGGGYDDWRFVLCKEGSANPCPANAREGAISIIGKRTSLWNEKDWINVKLEDSSICGETTILGKATIVRSFLMEAKF